MTCYLEDFPEVVYPIQCLDGIANRCSGQLYTRESALISAGPHREIVLPAIPDSKASGRHHQGRRHHRSDSRHEIQAGRRPLGPAVVGRARRSADRRVRPQHIAVRHSGKASWPGAVLGLAGPGKKIAGVMPCTVIRPDDMADRILNRDKHPQWQGERTKMVYSFPTDEKLWQKYAELRAGKSAGGTRTDRRHRVLRTAPRRDGRRGVNRLAGAVQPR